MIVGGPESEGHLTGDALKALIRNGVDEKMRIRDTAAPHPFLYNLRWNLLIVSEGKNGDVRSIYIFKAFLRSDI